LINDERSLNLAESKYFGLFINELNESYEILSYYMIKKNLKEIKEKAENNISKILKDLEYVSVTTDSWKSNTKDN
jgi:NADPH-dependent 7-cyano-7-deazaguanine reductase QueF-like protein